MLSSFCFSWEVPFLQWLQSFHSSFIDLLSKIITLFGEEYFLILVVGLLYWCIDKRMGRNVSLGVSGSILFGCLMQGAVLRLRPYMEYSEISCFRPAHSDGDPMDIVSQGYSFPSLHSTLSVGGYGTLALHVRKKIFTCIVSLIVILVGISRLYLGVHYPTDVFCGWILGIFVMLLFYFIEKKFGYKIGFAVQIVIGFIGFFYCRDNGFYSIYGVLLGLFFGFMYEEKKVNFTMNKKWYSYILRPVLGLLVFGGVSLLLKLPVSNVSVDDHMIFMFVYRTFRYALSTFATMGLYPHVFKRFKF